MSIIIYGPPGCGKTRNKEKLKNYFCCGKVVDCGESMDTHSPYPLSRKQKEEFKQGSTLFLTTEEPPASMRNSKRIYPYHLAAHAAGVK